MTDNNSRFQKSFYTDSQLSKGAHQKRLIKPNNPQENDFFTINYDTAAPSEDSIKPSEPTSAITCPWAMGGSGANHDDLNKSQTRHSFGHNNAEPNGEAYSHKKSNLEKQSENVHRVNSELKKIQNFYEDNPGYRVAQDYHKQRNMAERSKGVPWGTIDQGEPTDGDGIKRKERAPPPFATALNDEADPIRKPIPPGQKQDSMVLSQVTF